MWDRKTFSNYTGPYIKKLLKTCILIFAIEHSEYMEKSSQKYLYHSVCFTIILMILFYIDTLMDYFKREKYTNFTPLWDNVKLNSSLLTIYFSYLLIYILNSTIHSIQDDDKWHFEILLNVFIPILIFTIPYSLSNSGLLLNNNRNISNYNIRNLNHNTKHRPLLCDDQIGKKDNHLNNNDIRIYHFYEEMKIHAEFWNDFSKKFVGPYVINLLQSAILIFAIKQADFIKKCSEELLFLFTVFCLISFALFYVQIKMEFLEKNNVITFYSLWIYLKTIFSLLGIYFSYLLVYILNMAIHLNEDGRWSIDLMLNMLLVILFITIPYSLAKCRICYHTSRVINKIHTQKK